MGEIATDADSLPEGFQGRAVRSRVLIIEANMLMDEITNRLDLAPTRSDRPEFFPRESHELAINFAITARQEIRRCGRRYLAHKFWFRLSGEKIRFATVRDYTMIAKLDYAGRRIQSSAAITKRIE